MLFDTHCHLAMEDFDEDLDKVIFRAKENNIKILTVGTSPKDWKKTENISKKYDIVFAIAFSPHDAKYFSKENFNFFESFFSNKKIVAVGESGLDFHYFLSNKEDQIKVFEKQIEFAEQRRLPLIVHSRDSFKDTVAMLRGVKIPVVIHCFTYGPKEAEVFLENGFYLSYSGIVTFKSAEKIRETLNLIPLNKILVETDSPYLAPIPYRGKRCEPLFLKETAKFIANFIFIDEDYFFEQTFKNGQKIFSLNE